MKARIIGPASELGDVSEGLSFYGQTLTREWEDVDFTDEQLAKVRGNRYVEIKGERTDSAFDHDGNGKAGGSKADSVEDTENKARLDELGVSYSPRASSKSLADLVAKAEKAKAAADAEAEQALADAQEQLDRP